MKWSEREGECVHMIRTTREQRRFTTREWQRRTEKTNGQEHGDFNCLIGMGTAFKLREARWCAVRRIRLEMIVKWNVVCARRWERNYRMCEIDGHTLSSGLINNVQSRCRKASSVRPSKGCIVVDEKNFINDENNWTTVRVQLPFICNYRHTMPWRCVWTWTRREMIGYPTRTSHLDQTVDSACEI